jgi:hypothetical protein
MLYDPSHLVDVVRMWQLIARIVDGFMLNVDFTRFLSKQQPALHKGWTN